MKWYRQIVATECLGIAILLFSIVGCATDPVIVFTVNNHSKSTVFEFEYCKDECSSWSCTDLSCPNASCEGSTNSFQFKPGNQKEIAVYNDNHPDRFHVRFYDVNLSGINNCGTEIININPENIDIPLKVDVDLSCENRIKVKLYKCDHACTPLQCK